MGKPVPKKRNGPPAGKHGGGGGHDDAPPPKKKQVRGRKSSWPFIVAMLVIWEIGRAHV